MKHRPTFSVAIVLIAMIAVNYRAMAHGQYSYEEEPINYLKAPRTDPVAKLQQQIDQGKVTLEFSADHGYLPSVLKNLGVSVTSQMLVFSKTSFQLRRISPSTPRAVYFNDNTYVGWVQGGDVVELSAVDPNLGGVFYSLTQRRTDKPKFTRHTHQCTQCHASSLTQGVPGHTVRSVYTSADGHPILSAGTYRTNHASPLRHRWGGWYVTGTHGRLRHMGNSLAKKNEEPEQFDTQRGANITDLGDLIDTSPYLSPHSDIVALMVLEHQAHLQNLITKANYQARFALRDEAVMNKMLSRSGGRRSASTLRRFASAGNRLVDYMLFCDELVLKSPIHGTSGFAEQFAAGGPRDRQGRSLRDFDLKTHLFTHRCSYLIYSQAFDALPKPIRDHVYRRLYDVLSGRETDEKYKHLSAEDRQAIREILLDTKKGLPDYWKSDS